MPVSEIVSRYRKNLFQFHIDASLFFATVQKSEAANVVNSTKSRTTPSFRTSTCFADSAIPLGKHKEFGKYVHAE